MLNLPVEVRSNTRCVKCWQPRSIALAEIPAGGNEVVYRRRKLSRMPLPAIQKAAFPLADGATFLPFSRGRAAGTD